MEKASQNSYGHFTKDNFGVLSADVNSERIQLQFMVEDTRNNSEDEENWPDIKLMIYTKADLNKW
jgi:hypothetical protein